MLETVRGDLPRPTVEAGGYARGDKTIACSHGDKVCILAREVTLRSEGCIPGSAENVSEFLASCFQLYILHQLDSGT